MGFNDMGSILDKLIALNSEEGRSAAARQWKGQGGCVVGYLCSYMPEEIVHAAGMLPYRVMGYWREDILLAEAHLPINTCGYCRSTIDGVLKNGYDFLNGIIATRSCANMVRMFDAWRHAANPGFAEVLDLPYKTHPAAVEMYRAELEKLKGGLETNYGISITDEGLAEAIQVYDRTRQLLRQLYELRKAAAPLISGAECLAVVTAGMVMRKDEYNQLLEGLLVELEERGKVHQGQARIMVSGSILINPAEIQLIENLGGVVVADDLCTGGRYFWDSVEPGAEPVDYLAKLSERYLSAIPCARMFSQQRRYDYIAQVAKEYHVDGVVFSAMKYCDPWLYEYPHSAVRMEKLDLPHLRIEREYALTGQGQLQTRIGAFLEMLSLAEV